MKRWRYLGVFGPELMCCFGRVWIGGLPQTFWAVWDREARVLRERTRVRDAAVAMDRGRVRVRDRGVAIDLAYDEAAGTPIEVVTGPIWTRKRVVEVAGSVVVGGVERTLVARGILDDSGGRHERHTTWSWSAGVGTAATGQDLAWNLVRGVHDGPAGSERAVWIDGTPHEPPPVAFDDALTHVGTPDGSLSLRCTHEAVRRRDDNLVLVRSRYEQPFGAFSGSFPGGIALGEGLGVMERHDVRW